MKTNRGWRCLFAIGALAASAVSARGEDASTAEVRDLLRVSGVEESPRLMSSEILNTAREAAEASARATGRPVDKAHLDQLAASFGLEALLAKAAAAYGRHFDKQDVQELVAFYQTRVGRKLAARQSSINQDIQELAGPCGGLMVSLSRGAVVATPRRDQPPPTTR
jgi:hypothetical protein